jgi:hypothetical protein
MYMRCRNENNNFYLVADPIYRSKEFFSRELCQRLTHMHMLLSHKFFIAVTKQKKEKNFK